MAIKRKDFDEIRKKMGGKSAKEFVRASERSDAKSKALEKKKGTKKLPIHPIHKGETKDEGYSAYHKRKTGYDLGDEEIEDYA